MDEQPTEKRRNLFEWFQALVFALAVVMFLFTFVFKVVSIEGPSMLDTLHDGDRVVVSQLFYDPQPGDVVVFASPRFEENKPLIKRIIATEGQTVNIDYEQGVVYVDGVALNETYAFTKTNLDGGITLPLTVPEGEYFVMGDNRNGSKDSRFLSIGTIKRSEIVGKAVLRVFPFQSIKVI